MDQELLSEFKVAVTRMDIMPTSNDEVSINYFYIKSTMLGATNFYVQLAS